MSDALAAIHKIRDEHLSIRRHVKLVGDSVGDPEAMNRLQRERTEWVPGRPGRLAAKQQKLQQTLSFLDEGLRNHFALEENSLPPLAGDLLMKALILDHREIIKHVDGVKSMLAGIDADGLTREETLSKESQVQAAIDHIGSLIEDHATKEETLLYMLERALQRG